MLLVMWEKKQQQPEKLNLKSRATTIKAFSGSPYAAQIERWNEQTDLLPHVSVLPLKGDKAEMSHGGTLPEKSSGTQREGGVT